MYKQIDRETVKGSQVVVSWIEKKRELRRQTEKQQT